MYMSVLFSFRAEKFRQVTILFSDIVTFTNIAAAVQPTDIVSMLDEMYSRFDKLTTLHDVYKVGRQPALQHDQLIYFTYVLSFLFRLARKLQKVSIVSYIMQQLK